MVVSSVPLAGILLTLFFVFLGFPYDLLGARIARSIEASTDMTVRIGEVSPHLGLFGPGLAARQVLARSEGQGTVALDELVIRPAWSTAWFRGSPALHLDVEGDTGVVSGVVTVGDPAGFAGDLENVDVAALPLAALDSFDLTGRLDATVDLRAAAPEAGGGFEGRVDFVVRNGTVRPPDAPIPIPFTELSGRFDFGGESYLVVSGVKLEGPVISGDVEGTVGHAPAPGHQPLAVNVVYQVNDPNLAHMLANLGRRGADGRSTLQISGTLARPVMQ
jgi:type II secretion system protein N